MNHKMCDAFGLVQFLKASEDMVLGNIHQTLFPIWQRQILNARNPLQVLSDNMAHKSFYCGPKETKALGNQLPCHLKGCSTFDLLTAFIWKCRTIALEIEPEKIARVSCIIKTRGNFIVSDISNVGLGEVNFEWKKPIYAETAGAVALISFSVKHQNKNGELGILVPICLLQSTVD
ncbi:hypothetical protein CISIN_1g045856mg, partial [Citrus sinensis]